MGVKWFAKPNTAARAAKLCRETGVTFLLTAALQALPVVAQKAWFGLVVILPLAISGALLWATRSRIAALLCMVLGSAACLDAISLSFVVTSISSFTLGLIVLTCALPLAAIRGLRGAWAWRRLRQHPIALERAG